MFLKILKIELFIFMLSSQLSLEAKGKWKKEANHDLEFITNYKIANVL